MADVKNLLKEARKLIENGNFIEAQECCKNILRADKQNYFALVLFGKSLQDSDQACLAYQKAITCKRDNPLAWQGLAQYYENKTDDISKQKLFAIYNEMLYLDLEDEKTKDIIIKLGQLGVKLKSSEALHVLVGFITKTENHNLKKVTEVQIINILKVDTVCDVADIPSVLDILSKVYKIEPTDSLELLQCKLILLKSNTNTLKELLELEFFRKKTSLQEFVCQWLCEKFTKTMSFNGLDLENLAIITEGIKSSKQASLLNCMLFYEKGLYLEAYKQCVPIINYNKSEITEVTFIIRCTMMLKKWSVVQKLATNFITKANEEKLSVLLRKFLFHSLVKQQKWKQAIANAQLIPINEMNYEEQACLAECLIECDESAEHIIETLKVTEYYKQLVALSYLKQGKYNELICLLQEPADNALYNFYLGKAFWELKQYNDCLIHLLKAAKLNSDHAETFLYLGHFYLEQKNDESKALKCYEKAYSLNNTNVNIIKSLGTLYIKMKRFDSHFELLSTHAKSVKLADTWVYKKLGIHNLNNRDWESAITNFNKVIKDKKDDAAGFECLADAYYGRGSYTSALRSYNKAMLLEPRRSSYCLTRMASIHYILVNYQEAIPMFEKVIKIDSQSTLALKGIAETWVGFAMQKFDANMFESARDCVQHAVDYILQALKIEKNFIIFWDILASAFVNLMKLPDKYAHILMIPLSDENATEPIKLGKCEIILQAISCYSYLAKLRQRETTFELTSTYFIYYQTTKLESIGETAINFAMMGVKEQPNSWRNWDLLGIISFHMNKYKQAQHCFIKALHLNKNVSAAKTWCHLGALYLQVKRYDMANYCFWRGQSTLPSHPNNWIGQAIIAEHIKEDEAMDLFRHASQLAYHRESALGYADWVCRTMNRSSNTNAIEFLHAIPRAMDLIERFVHFEPTHSIANNMLGLLKEKSGLMKSAIQSYEKAFKYSADKDKSIILMNIGRILLRMKKYEEAIKIFQAIPEASFNSTVGLALALFKKGLYEESYAAYDTALHWLCTDESQKSQLMVAMAGIIYKLKGANDAKTMLFKSVLASDNKPSPHSLLAICSLGITHPEQGITKLALSELQKYERDTQFVYDIGFLKSFISVSQGDVEQGINSLSETALDYPGNGLIWLRLAQYCLAENAKCKAKIGSSFARKALSSGHFSNSNLVNVFATGSISEYIAGNRVEALRLAKMGLHLYPNEAVIWAALLFCISSNNDYVSMEKNWLLAATGHMRMRLAITRPLSRWLNLLEKKIANLYK